MADNTDATGENVERKRGMQTGIIGSTGLRAFGGIVAEEFLPALSGPKAAKVYREMSDNDPIVGAVVFAITMLIRNVQWTWQPVDESDGATEAKEFVESVIEDMTTPFADIMDEVCTMFPYGYAPMEIVWKQRNGKSDDGSSSNDDDGKIGVRSISLRAQNTIYKWAIDPDDGTIDGLWQQPWSGPQVFIPIEKLLLFRTSTVKNNPEGRSILRTAYRPWYFKKKIEEIEGVGVERDLAGLPVASIPLDYFSSDADPDQKLVLANWQRLVTNLRRDKQEGVLIPSDRDQHGNRLFELELMNSGGSRTFDTTKIIDRYDRQIATSVLADFIFLGQAAVGSFALSSDKTALFGSAVGGFLKSIAEVFNRHFVTRLWEYNNFDPAMMPKLKPGDVEGANLAELSQLITALSGAGAPLFPDRDLENFIREEAGLPPAPEEGTEMMTPGPDGKPIAIDPRIAAKAASAAAAAGMTSAATGGAGGGAGGSAGAGGAGGGLGAAKQGKPIDNEGSGRDLLAPGGKD